MKPGDKVRKKANPSRIGILGNETSGPPSRLRHLVTFLDGEEQFVLLDSLEKVETRPEGPYELITAGRYGRVSDLRGAITYYRLSGRLANLIYSLNTTDTKFLAYQFKPVLQFLDSPSSGILIADEVGLGKTIEAGLIWTELRAREDARRLLVVCPAILREKWRRELQLRFGVNAEIVDVAGLLERLEQARGRPQDSFALIASMQGIRPPAGWNDSEDRAESNAAKLARLLDDVELEEPLFDFVVIDEAHYLKNRETQTYRLGALLRPVALNMAMLSATPIQLKSADLFNLIHLLDEDAFPYEGSFDYVLRANAPIVRLRDRVLAGAVEQGEFVETLREASGWPHFRNSQQIQYLIENPPSDDALRSARERSQLADRLDRINPLTKVVTRTLKRDVDENKVHREPHVIRAPMSPVERAFYEAVTDKVREYCARQEVGEGFLLTIPQRQMASSMAAACRGWLLRLDSTDSEEDAEIRYELDADDLELARGNGKTSRAPAAGNLLHELVAITRRVGDFQMLRAHDSKYTVLLSTLKRYWRNHRGRKVVLFSFYRHTLHYLAQRLREDGIESVVLHGGMDKTAALEHFASADGPDILLSSEVASEGVDLQFSSVLVNYDLPWNPAKIEQRIGRIDRIGQEAPRILIWNLVYEDTVDDRVCERLLERIHTFERALGSMEALLGDEIRTLTMDLLSHRLTPAQEQERIDRAAVAIETVNLQQERLEAEATNLIAHGDFIQNKVKAANELGRYIRGEDLLAFVRDFFLKHYAGTRLIAEPTQPDLYRIELSTEARMEFTDFIQRERLQGRTALLSASPPRFQFENRLGKSPQGVERVTQDHPLTRFVAQRLSALGSASTYFPVSACQVQIGNPSLPPGDYVYVVARWSVSGSRELERLEYFAKRLPDGPELSADDAETIVNQAALQGREWLSAGGEVDGEIVAALHEQGWAALEDAFVAFRDGYQREDADRITMMIGTLNHHLQKKRQKIEERISAMQQSRNERRARLIPALRGQLKKEQLRIEQKIAELQLRATLKAQDSLVSTGVVRVL